MASEYGDDANKSRVRWTEMSPKVRRVRFKFRLYISGGVNSMRAVANLNHLCQVHLPDRHVIEIVDVSQEQARALADRVVMTPTLIKLSPAPVCRIVGTLSHPEPVLLALGLFEGWSAKASRELPDPSDVADDD
jgi:circadian clock protein KaiB